MPSQYTKETDVLVHKNVERKRNIIKDATGDVYVTKKELVPNHL